MIEKKHPRKRKFRERKFDFDFEGRKVRGPPSNGDGGPSHTQQSPERFFFFIFWLLNRKVKARPDPKKKKKGEEDAGTATTWTCSGLIFPLIFLIVLFFINKLKFVNYAIRPGK